MKKPSPSKSGSQEEKKKVSNPILSVSGSSPSKETRSGEKALSSLNKKVNAGVNNSNSEKSEKNSNFSVGGKISEPESKKGAEIDKKLKDSLSKMSPVIREMIPLPLDYFKKKVSLNSLRTVFDFLDSSSLVLMRLLNKGMNDIVLKFIGVSKNGREKNIEDLTEAIKIESLNYQEQISSKEKNINQIRQSDLMMLKSMIMLPESIVNVLNIIGYFFDPTKKKEFGGLKLACTNRNFHKMVISDPEFVKKLTKFDKESFIYDFLEFEMALSAIDTSKLKSSSMVVYDLFEYMMEVKKIFANSKLLRLVKWLRTLKGLERFHKKITENI
jgi:hypothetical protein